MNDQSNRTDLYSTYMKTGRTLEIFGGGLLLLSIILNETVGKPLHGVIFPLALIGAAVLLYGGGSLRPHNQIKAFAAQLTRTGDRAFAEGLLDALTKNKSVSVTKRTQNMVGTAILSYGAEPGADPELVKKLDSAAASCLKILKF